jgi:tripeptide aminopeptidase
MFNQYKFTCADRFMRYVQIDTQSDPSSTSIPTTNKQKQLSLLLVEELKSMGISDAEMDEYGYVYATIPATSNKDVPVLCFCAHVDTAPDCSGENVKPILHKQYNGSDIILPDDNTQVLNTNTIVELKNKIGHDIITASGKTLLGADDKAGVAEIMDAAYFFVQNTHIKHGKIRLLFTPDEEVGKGADKVDLKKLGAHFGYTLDGGLLGTIEDENFSANAIQIKINGVAAHPGYAFEKMENAIKIASEIITRLPKELSPEKTQDKQGFIHPVQLKASLENAEMSYIVRSFETSTLPKYEKMLKDICDEVMKIFPNATYEFKVIEQYRNMKEILQKHPQVMENAILAIRRAGILPLQHAIRGGTDGSRLSFMGLPCPNLFAGEQNIHSKIEWISVQDMQKAVETIVHIACVWEENA